MKRNQLGCPLGTLPGNRARSLPSDRVEVSIVTEQLVSHSLLVLQSLLKLII